MTTEFEGYLTANDLAEFLRMSRSNVYSLVQRGILPPGIRIGGCRRWNMAEIRSFLRGGR